MQFARQPNGQLVRPLRKNKYSPCPWMARPRVQMTMNSEYQTGNAIHFYDFRESSTRATHELCSKRVASAYVVRLSLRSSLRLAYATTMAAYAHTLHTKGLTQHLREHNLAPGHSASFRAICFPSKAQHTTGLLRPRV